ncbi:MAG: hypothetical protein IPK83_18305 [Planctomycetes bacterium]|nr:hypothetical protein [Planctomycetota bacterium]
MNNIGPAKTYECAALAHWDAGSNNGTPHQYVGRLSKRHSDAQPRRRRCGPRNRRRRDAGRGNREQISFLSNPKYESMLKSTAAGAVVVADEQAVPDGMTVIRTGNPYAAIMAIMVRVHGYRRHRKVGVHAAAVIDPSAKIGANATIHHGVTIEANTVIGDNVVLYPGVYIANDCRVGDDCIFYPNVVVYEGCLIGNRVTLHAGTIIGEDGLGYAPVGDKWHKIPDRH